MSKKFYITTSLPYVNAAPHIGFALEAVQADVLARWHKQQGEDVFFLTGTDEHGAKIARAAEAAGKTPQDLVNENAKKFYDLKSKLDLSWDLFIRTSDQVNHWPVAQELWKRLYEAGDLYKKTYKGLYCVGHEAFVTQKDLIDGKCADHKKEPEVLEEENWFFKLSRHEPDIRKAIESGQLEIIPKTRKNEVLSFLSEKLEDISFSRPSKDLKWGIPVPGDKTQTMYVWADALTNYISGYYVKGSGGIKIWEKYPADIQVIGKDILRFHALIWPAMLMSAKLPLPKTIFVHGYILSNGQKMSKSLGNVVDPDTVLNYLESKGLNEKQAIDALRYYLLRESPSYEDCDFTFEKFEQRYNADLANSLGNFAARILTMGEEYLSHKFSAPNSKVRTWEEVVEDRVKEKIKETEEIVFRKTEGFRFNEALESIQQLIKFGDIYTAETKPFEREESWGITTIKGIPITNLIWILKNVGEVLQPFLPETATKITESIIWQSDILKVTKIENLFPRI